MATCSFSPFQILKAIGSVYTLNGLFNRNVWEKLMLSSNIRASMSLPTFSQLEEEVMAYLHFFVELTNRVAFQLMSGVFQ